MSIVNTVGTFCDDPKDEQCIKLKKWMDENFDWMQFQIADLAIKDPYWHQVKMQLKCH